MAQYVLVLQKYLRCPGDPNSFKREFFLYEDQGSNQPRPCLIRPTISDSPIIKPYPTLMQTSRTVPTPPSPINCQPKLTCTQCNTNIGILIFSRHSQRLSEQFCCYSSDPRLRKPSARINSGLPRTCVTSPRSALTQSHPPDTSNSCLPLRSAIKKLIGPPSLCPNNLFPLRRYITLERLLPGHKSPSGYRDLF